MKRTTEALRFGDQVSRGFGAVAAVVAGAAAAGASPIQAAPQLDLGEVKLIAGDPHTNDHFGLSVCVDGDRAVVGAAYVDDANPADDGCCSGAAYVYVRQGADWVQEARLTAADAACGDYFGFSVAIEGDTIVVGAAQKAGGYVREGAAYVFERVGAVWSQVAKLTAGTPMPSDHLGTAVAISGDAIAVGAPSTPWTFPPYDTGAVMLYEQPPSGWTDAIETVRLVGAGCAAGGDFGRSVELRGDQLVVGAPGGGYVGFEQPGRAYVFRCSGGWTNAWQVAELVPSDPVDNMGFGFSVASRGTTIAVGATNWGGGPTSAGVYLYDSPSPLATEDVKLVASDPQGVSSSFGRSLSFEGSLLAVGAPEHWVSEQNSGCVYLFRETAQGWMQQKRLLGSDTDSMDLVGMSVCMDSGRILGGAFGDEHSGLASAGSAYLFTWPDGVHAWSPFDSELEGWLEAGDPDVNLVWTPMNGGREGYVRVEDVGVEGASVIAAGRFRSPVVDWTLLDDVGILRLRSCVLENPAGAPLASGIKLFVAGPGGSARYSFQDLPTSTWRIFAAPIREPFWTVESGTWSGLMANVSHVEITLANASGADVHGLDEVMLQVPTCVGTDCNGNGICDDCDIALGLSQDCQFNGVPDECDIASGSSLDCDGSGLPDECEAFLDCNQNSVHDPCDIAAGSSEDCNGNWVPDDCDIAAGTSFDANGDGVPDECQGLASTCFCDAAHAPCGNAYATGGCINSTGLGAVLTGVGSNSLAADDLVLIVAQAPPGTPCVWVQGNVIAQVPFKDGNRCAVGATVRLYTTFIGAAGSVSTDRGIVATSAARGYLIPPTDHWYQLWYRDPLGPCNRHSNLSNALRVSWVP